MFIKTFKGYEDKTQDLDNRVNQWLVTNQGAIEVVDFKVVMSHEPNSRGTSGDLICCVVYKAPKPLAD